VQDDQKSSIKYWDKRWSTDPHSVRSSWPDGEALALEISALNKYLPRDAWASPIVEIGCGNLHVLRSGILTNHTRTVGEYYGIEGSKAVRHTNNGIISGFPPQYPKSKVVYRDLTGSQALKGIPDGYLLSKRTLQNIHPSYRGKLIERLRAKFKHGTLIEDVWTFRNALDRERNAAGKGNLGVPDFNWPLCWNELLALAGGTFKVIPFMGLYYSVTRNWDNCPFSIREAAGCLQFRALDADELNIPIGPVVMIQW
jgi:hypothetical protein